MNKWLRIYESHIFELRIKTLMKVILAVMCTTQAVVKIRSEFFQALFSLLPKQCTLLRGSLSFTSLPAVQIYDFHIFLALHSSLHRFIWNQHNDQLPVGLLALLVGRALHRYGRGHGFKSCTGLNFFRPYFHYCSSSVHYCKDHFYSCLYLQFKYMIFIYSQLFIISFIRLRLREILLINFTLQ